MKRLGMLVIVLLMGRAAQAAPCTVNAGVATCIATVGSTVQGGSGSYVAAHGTSTDQSGAGDGYYTVGQQLAGIYYVNRGFLEFDLSSVPANATIDAPATLTLTIGTNSSSVNFNILQKDYTWQSPLLSDANYNGCSAAAAATTFCNSVGSCGAAGAHTTATILTSSIVPGGTQRYCFTSNLDDASSAPTLANEYVQFVRPSAASAADRPTLQFAYHVGPPATSTPTVTQTPIPTPATTPTRLPCYADTPTPGVPPCPRCGQANP